MITMTKYKTSSAWFITLFGAIFLIVGLGIGFSATKTVIQTALTKNWPAAEAVIQSANLKSVRGDSTTYRAEGKYSYVWQGNSYTSDVLFFGRGSDSQYDYHSNIVSDLKSHLSSGDPMTARINPKNPSQSILFNKIRWGQFSFMLLFATIFGGAGAGIIWFSRYLKSQSARDDQRRLEHPKKPWMWREEWQSPTIKNNNKAGFIMITIFTVFWNLMSLPVLFIIPDEIIKNKNYLALIALLFPIVGVCFAVWTFRLYHQWQRFKDNTFTLDTYPAGLGHSLQGHFSTQNNLPDDVVFAVTLSSIRKYYTGSGKNRESREEILWQDEQHIPLKAGRFGTQYRLPIFFKLPSEAEQSDWENGSNAFLWRLNIKSELDGADLDQSFQVPVFDPAKYDFDLPAPSTPASVNTDAYIYKGDWQKTGVIYSEDADSQYYYFPPARHKGVALSLSLITLIFGAVAVSRFFVAMPVMLAIIFGGISVLLGYFALHLWLHKTSIETSKSGLSLRHGLFKGKFTDITPQDIQQWKLKNSMSSGTILYYSITAKLKTGKSITLANHMRGKRDVENLMEKIKLDMGLSV